MFLREETTYFINKVASFQNIVLYFLIEEARSSVYRIRPEQTLDRTKSKIPFSGSLL